MLESVGKRVRWLTGGMVLGSNEEEVVKEAIRSCRKRARDCSKTLCQQIDRDKVFLFTCTIKRYRIIKYIIGSWPRSIWAELTFSPYEYKLNPNF